MKNSLITFASILILLLDPTNAAQCPELKYEERYCGDSRDVICSYSVWNKFFSNSDIHTGKKDDDGLAIMKL